MLAYRNPRIGLYPTTARSFLRFLVLTFKFNLSCWYQTKLLRFRRNWGLLSVEENAKLRARVALLRRAMRSMS